MHLYPVDAMKAPNTRLRLWWRRFRPLRAGLNLDRGRYWHGARAEDIVQGRKAARETAKRTKAAKKTAPR